MKPLKALVTVILLIGIGVHIYSLAVTPYPFPDEPNWSHYAHLVAYIVALYAVYKLHAFFYGKLLYAAAVVFPVYTHVHYFLQEIKQQPLNYANIVACISVVVFLPLGISLFRKEHR